MMDDLAHEHVPLLQSLLNGPRPITTVAALKPEAIGKHLGRILRRFAQEGFSVVAMRLDYLDKETAVILCQGDDPASKVPCSFCTFSVIVLHDFAVINVIS